MYVTPTLCTGSLWSALGVVEWRSAEQAVEWMKNTMGLCAIWINIMWLCGTLVAQSDKLLVMYLRLQKKMYRNVFKIHTGFLT